MTKRRRTPVGTHPPPIPPGAKGAGDVRTGAGDVPGSLARGSSPPHAPPHASPPHASPYTPHAPPRRSRAITSEPANAVSGTIENSEQLERIAPDEVFADEVGALGTQPIEELSDRHVEALNDRQIEALGTQESEPIGTIAPLDGDRIEPLDDDSIDTRRLSALKPALDFDTSDADGPDPRLEAHKKAIESALAAQERGVDPDQETSVVVQIDDDWWARLDLPPE